jgi:non-heme chloroperoxidase
VIRDRRRRRLATLALGLGLMPAAGCSTTPSSRPAARREAFVTTDGTTLSMLAAGQQHRGTPLLFVPGWSMPAALWAPHLEHAATVRPAWVLDPRGQGESAIPPGGYDADRRADDLFEALASLPRPAIVVAWSLAGVEVLHGLRRHGESRVAGLVLVDSSLGEGPPGTGEAVAAFRARLSADRPAALGEFARAIFRTPRTPEQIDWLVAQMSRVPLQASLAMLDWGLSRERLRSAARGLRAPLSIMITPQYREQARLHRTARPASEVELFERAGHALFADEPARFDGLLASFAARIDRRG